MYIHPDSHGVAFDTMIQRYSSNFGFPYYGSDVAAMKVYKEEELERICNAQVSHDGARELLSFRQLSSLLSKNPSLVGSTLETREAAALKSYHSAERRCRTATRRLRYYQMFPRRSPVMSQLLNMMSYDIFKLLGVGPSGDDFSVFVDSCTFGPGAVLGLAKAVKGRRDATPYGKVGPENEIQVTLDALQLAGPFLYRDSPFKDYLVQQPASIVDCNRLAFVPKDAATERIIAIEPYFNSFLQLGQMTLLARKLRKWGVSINDQTKNQDLAKMASVQPFPNGWATLDLSSASDCISLELVQRLLPPAWFKFLSATRSPRTLMPDGSKLLLSKFSSMGNGITFPLECMIFAAAVRASRAFVGCKQDWAVYGDDIIVSQRASLLLTELLRFLGFSLNSVKSYYVGAFRESCGKDYLGGHPVRPYYLKSSLDDFAIHRLVNQLALGGENEFLRGYLMSLAGKRMLIGPRCNDVPITHVCAPVSVLKRRGLLAFDYHLQAWRVTALQRITVLPRVRLCQKNRTHHTRRQALNAWLSKGMSSDAHFIRGPVQEIEQVKLLPILGNQLEYDGLWDLWLNTMNT